MQQLHWVTVKTLKCPLFEPKIVMLLRLPRADHFCPLIENNPPSWLIPHTPLKYFMPPLNLFFGFGDWLKPPPHSLSPLPLTFDPAGRPHVVSSEGKVYGLCDPALTPLYSDTFTRASTIYSNASSWNPAGYCVTGISSFLLPLLSVALW